MRRPHNFVRRAAARVVLSGGILIAAAAFAANDLPGVNLDGGNARVGASLAPGGGVKVGPPQPLRVTPGGVAPIKPLPRAHYSTSCTPMRDAAGQCVPGRY